MSEPAERVYDDAIASFVAAIRAEVKAEQERDQARAALARIEAKARLHAVGERARGDSDRERDWLDVIAIIERQSTPKEHP